jgi:hypothetical protein
MYYNLGIVLLLTLTKIDRLYFQENPLASKHLECYTYTVLVLQSNHKS